MKLGSPAGEEIAMILFTDPARTRGRKALVALITPTTLALNYSVERLALDHNNGIVVTTYEADEVLLQDLLIGAVSCVRIEGKLHKATTYYLVIANSDRSVVTAAPLLMR